MQGLLPAQHLEPTVMMLDHQRARLDEVAGIDVRDVLNLPDDRMMDMAADHAVDAAFPGFAGELLLERADEIHRILDLEFRPGRKRPVWQTERPARRVEMGVDEQREVVSPVAEEGE